MVASKRIFYRQQYSEALCLAYSLSLLLVSRSVHIEALPFVRSDIRLVLVIERPHRTRAMQRHYSSPGRSYSHENIYRPIKARLPFHKPTQLRLDISSSEMTALSSFERLASVTFTTYRWLPCQCTVKDVKAAISSRHVIDLKRTVTAKVVQ